MPLTVQSITAKRLLLKLAATGTVTMTIVRQAGDKHHVRRQLVKTIVVKVDETGETDVKLPRLAAGRYLVKVALAGANSVMRTLTVSRGA